MKNVMKKLQSASNKVFSCLPTQVIAYFELNKENSEAFQVDVSFQAGKCWVNG